MPWATQSNFELSPTLNVTSDQIPHKGHCHSVLTVILCCSVLFCCCVGFWGKLVLPSCVLFKSCAKGAPRGTAPAVRAKAGLGPARARACAQGDIKSSTGEWHSPHRQGLLRLWFCCICLKIQTFKPISSKISFLYSPAKTWAHGSVVSLARVDYAIELHQLLQEKHEPWIWAPAGTRPLISPWKKKGLLIGC